MPDGTDFPLLQGFRYECLPGCGMCCFTSPAVRVSEQPRLLQLDPSAPLVERGDGWSVIASRPNGGACHFLEATRCRCHRVRPATCAEFPLTAHAAGRVQVSLVLGCPGVSLEGLDPWADGVGSGPSAHGLASELATITHEIELASTSGEIARAAQRWSLLERRVQRRTGRAGDGDPRATLYPISDAVVPTKLSSPEFLEGVEPEEALEKLPLAYDTTWGRLSWRPVAGGVEFLALEETGGVRPRREVLPVPTRSPGLETDALRRLKGYLGYVLARDETLGTAYSAYLESDGRGVPLSELLFAQLHATAVQVVRMALLRRSLAGDGHGVLRPGDVDRGIRATDMQLLDAPTAGLRL